MAGYRAEQHSSGLAQIWLTLALSILQIIPTHLDTARAQSQAFVQSATSIHELRQLVEEVTLKNDFGSNINFDKSTVDTIGGIRNVYRGINLDLSFEPPMLDFGEHAIGMPHIETVRVFNPHPENILRMLSISGSTPHFHCSFFQDKSIPPGGNTTFDIVFLARVPGNVENTIFIHTSTGMSPYQVFGVGVPNPYRLRPFLGARVPINTSYSPLINMHNPYSSGLLVTEIYSSGGDLHLELPTGSLEAPQNLWVIPPYQTRSVMRASFTGRVENNHTAFIRIKTNHSSSPEEVDEFLMLPVEVEVSSAPGLYSSLELLDFGTLRSLDEPKTVPLYLLNTNPKTIHISGVSLMRANPAITIDFKPTGIKFSEKHTKVADITFNPLRANTSRMWSGKIIVKAKDKATKLQIPYQAHVLQGTLSYDKNCTLFYLPPDIPREVHIKPLALRNFFNFSLVIQRMSFPEEVKSIFRLSNFSGPFEIQPQESDSTVSLVFSPNDTVTSVSTDLLLTTNASVFRVPVHAYTGKLKFSAHGGDNKEIDFGTMSTKDVRSIFFAVLNPNPVEVEISSFECDLEPSDCTIGALSIEEGNKTYHLSDTAKPLLEDNPLVIPAYYMAVMRVEVQAPDIEGVFLGEVKVFTKYEELKIPTLMRTVEGCLGIKPDHVIMKPTFPGYPQSQNMAVVNNFGYRMKLESLIPDPPDDRFFHRAPRKQPDVEVEPHKKQKIGRIVFDPKKYCDTDCYVGLPQADEHVWLQSLALPEETQDVDRLFYNYLRNKWMKLEETGANLINVTMKLNSNLVKGLDIPVSAELIWPRLVRNDIVNFPLTYIGNSSQGEVTLYNPSDSVILVQLLPIAAYQDPNTVLELLTDRFDSELIEIDEPDTFFMIDVTDKNPECNPPPTALGESTPQNDPPPPPPPQKPTSHQVQQQEEIKIHVNGKEMTVIKLPPGSQHNIIIDYDTTTMGPLPKGHKPAQIIKTTTTTKTKTPQQPKPSTKTTIKKTKEHSQGKCLSSHAAIEENFGVKPNRTALTLGIRPRQNVTVNIGFRPNDNRERISLILIRNNLTVLDAFMVRGHGAKGELRLNGKKPSPRNSLPFELKESHLVDCDRSSPKARVPPNFTVKRTLNLKNIGQLPLAIHKFQINGYDCEGFGFRVLQCRPMELKPNETQRLDIAFTPDFTLSKIERQLSIHTYNSETLEYPLVATLPPHMLSICTSALPRPPWEQLLYAVSAILMLVLFIGILTAAYLEAVRLMEPVVRRVEENGEIDKFKRFDLRNIAVLSGSGDGGGGGGGAKSGSQGVLSSISGKLSFGQSSSQRTNSGSTSSIDTRTERRLPNNKERVRVSNSYTNSTPYSHSKRSNDFSQIPLTQNIGNHELPQQQKPIRNRRRASSDLETSWNLSNNRENSKETPFSKMSDLDPIGDPPEVILRTPSVEELDPAARIKLPKGKRKSKATSSSSNSRKEDREARRAQSKLARKLEEFRGEPDRDDSSSTTTECSNADSEQSEKNIKFDHVVSNGEAVWSSGGPKASAKVSDPEAGVLDLDALKFEDVKPKSKSRKNAKHDKNMPFNGDVLRPSTLELPYTIPSDKNHRGSKEPTSPHSIAAKAAAKATKKAFKAAKDTGPRVEADAASTSSSEHDNNSGSPPPLWDQPKPMPTNQGRQLNVQPKHADSPGAVGTKSSQYAPGALRPNSYSSAVAGSKNDTPKRGKQKSKLGKTYSAPESLPSAFVTVGEQPKTKHPGAIGTTTKSLFGHKSKSLPRSTNPWDKALNLNDIDSASETSSTPSTGPSSPGIFGLGSGKNDGKSGTLDDFYDDGFGNSMWDNKSLGLSEMAPASSRNQPKNKMGGVTDLFGGLGVSSAPPSSSVWESTPSHVSKPVSSSPKGWTSKDDHSPHALFRSSNLWDNPTSSANKNSSADNGWNTSSELFPSSIWSSSSDNSRLLDSSNQEGQNRGFDPFAYGSNSISSIWSPASSLDSSNRSPWTSPGSRDKL